jgi:hypothetical protein
MGKGSQTSTNVSRAHPKAMEMYRFLLNQAKGVYGTPYEAYREPLVANLNNNQRQGIANVARYSDWQRM